jgi:hypothetical protein
MEKINVTDKSLRAVREAQRDAQRFRNKRVRDDPGGQSALGAAGEDEGRVRQPGSLQPTVQLDLSSNMACKDGNIFQLLAEDLPASFSG